MPRTKLRVIPDPGRSRVTLLRHGEGTVIFRGPRPDVVYACGACDAPLLDGVAGTHVVDLVLQCHGCGGFNESPARDATGLEGQLVAGPVTRPLGRYLFGAEVAVTERTVVASAGSIRRSGITFHRFDA